MQGLIGNCWIIAPISAAASIIEKDVFRPNQSGCVEYQKGEQSFQQDSQLSISYWSAGIFQLFESAIV